MATTRIYIYSLKSIKTVNLTPAMPTCKYAYGQHFCDAQLLDALSLNKVFSVSRLDVKTVIIIPYHCFSLAIKLLVVLWAIIKISIDCPCVHISFWVQLP